MYFPTIGLEIHIELKTKSKMFCSCKNDPFQTEPNVNICPVCTGQPGSLPVINKEAIKKVVKTGISLNCKINQRSYFERKNYFYPDLPKGYQISQYKKPLCENGYLDIPIYNLETKKTEFKRIRINRIHLEEDTGKLIHSPQGYTLVDLNRAGVPLMELVTEPDIHSAREASTFAKELQLILRYLDVSDADMEKGQMRVEVNISLMRIDDKKNNDIDSKISGNLKKLGTKVEIKNLNSFQAVEGAIEYEIERQTEILERGEKVIQETRGWDAQKGITFSQREKEYAHDYRYFPEPDLLPFILDDNFLEEIKKEIPELPSQKRERYKNDYSLSNEEIEIYIKNQKLANFFEKVISNKKEDKNFIHLASNYIINEFQKFLEEDQNILDKNIVLPDHFYNLIELLFKKEISSKIAKILLEEMTKTGKDPKEILIEKGLNQISESNALEEIIKNVILENEKAVLDYKSGKENAFQFLIGKIMEKTKGKANPEVAREVLKKLLQ